jgi:protein-tyrosine-phosphatase
VNGGRPVILFVCSHNVCRSAMAEALAVAEAARRGHRVRIMSAGTQAVSGFPAAPVAEAVLREVGITLDEHRSRRINEGLVAAATLVVTMTAAQRDLVQTMFPRSRDKVVAWGDVAGGGDVEDPVGGSVEEVRALRERLASGMDAIFAQLERAHQAGNRPKK